MKDIKKFIGGLKAFDKSKYKGKLGRDYLILYTIWILNKNGFEALFDYIVVAAHKLFPDAGFSLTTFREYPDARTVRDTLWHLKDERKKWIEGNTQSGYVLTKRGKIILEKVIDCLEKNKDINPKREYSSTSPSKHAYWINKVIRSSDGFKKFQKQEKITSSDIRLSIGATSDTPVGQLKANVNRLLEYARDLSDKEVEKYLLYVKARLEEE